jgi:hypothetical protein
LTNGEIDQDGGENGNKIYLTFSEVLDQGLNGFHTIKLTKRVRSSLRLSSIVIAISV